MGARDTSISGIDHWYRLDHDIRKARDLVKDLMAREGDQSRYSARDKCEKSDWRKTESYETKIELTVFSRSNWQRSKWDSAAIRSLMSIIISSYLRSTRFSVKKFRRLTYIVYRQYQKRAASFTRRHGTSFTKKVPHSELSFARRPLSNLGLSG